MCIRDSLASLRVKEKQINKDKDDGIRTQEAMKLTLNDMFKRCV